MAFNCVVVNGTLGTTAGATTDFTSSGFGTPTAAIVIGSWNNTTAAGISIGFWDGTNQCVMSTVDEDNQTNIANKLISRTDYIWALSDYNGDVVWEASATCSNITDGVRLTIGVDNTTTAFPVTVILFTGCGASVETITPSSSGGGDVDSSTLSFTPLMCFATSVNQTVATSPNSGSSQVTDSYFSFGAAAKTATGTDYAGWMYANQDAAADVTASALLNTNEFVGALTYGGTEDWMEDIQADTWNSTFVRFNTANAGASEKFFTLILGDSGGGDFYCRINHFTSPTSASTDTVVNTGVNVLGVVTVALPMDAIDSVEINQAASGASFGLSDGTTSGVHNFTVRPNATASNSTSVSSTGAVIDLNDNDSGTNVARLDATAAFSGPYVTYDWSVVDTGAPLRHFQIAFGDSVNVSDTVSLSGLAGTAGVGTFNGNNVEANVPTLSLAGVQPDAAATTAVPKVTVDF